MEIAVRPAGVKMRGNLNENVRTSDLVAALRQAAAGADAVVADLSHVPQANSPGILSWLKAVKEAQVPIIYEDLPPWFVERAMELPELLCGDVMVRSFQLSLYCPETNERRVRTISLDRDLTLVEGAERPAFRFPDDDGHVFEVDFDDEHFQVFVDRIVRKRKRHDA